ncbi:SUMF1/EgtB/PvdO family nonheme iron enzyme [candidate division WOR-3 bacterium]|nr:SUMF1/EgtB/PvdO family nonheme iron enzyme [candidate division WOR-3 bacterium]
MKYLPLFLMLSATVILSSCRTTEVTIKYNKIHRFDPPIIMTEQYMNVWEMVLVRKGSFIMGSTEGIEDETPEQEIFLDDFYIDKYEVTCYQYMLFCEATGHQKPSNWPNGILPQSKYFEPVRYVSYEDAAAYANWLAKTIPTESQWEKAARGEDGRIYPWGNEWTDQGARTIEDRFSVPQNIGWLGELSMSPYGALDMAGNVFEWTSTWYNKYPGSSAQSEYFGNIVKVIRGGSFENSIELATTTYRGIAYPAISYSNIGFRCVFTPQNRGDLPPTILILPDGTVEW